MPPDLVEGNIGAVGSYDLKFESGKLSFDVNVGWGPAGVSAKLGVSLDGGAICDALAAAIPGTVDDALLGVLKAALQAVK